MIYNVLLILASLFVIPPLAVAIGRYKHLDLSNRILLAYLVVSLFAEIIGWYTSINRIQNHFIFNIFIPIEFLCLSYVCWINVKTAEYKKVIFILACFIFLFQVSSNLYYWNSFNRFNSVANALPNLGLMLFVILYFYELLRDQQEAEISTLSMFWISSGILLYVSINFFLFVFGEFVMFNSSKDLAKLTTFILSISNITHRSFLTIGLWFSKTPQQLSSSSK